MTQKRLPVVKDSSLRAQVVEILKESIFSGAFLPGETLVELQLARELQVSQSTVREALLQLEHLGLVVRVPNRSTVVTRFTEKEVIERVEIRIRLEGMAAVAAASRLSTGDYEELERRLRVFHAAIAGGDPFARVEADLNFHRFIWNCSGNETLVHILEELTVPLFAFTCILRKRGLVTAKPLYNPHEALITALKLGEPAKIESAVAAHIRPSFEHFLKVAVDWQTAEPALSR